MNWSIPEPKPEPGKKIVVNELIKDLLDRSEFGIQKYGTPLMTFNKRDAIVDLYQELLDAIVYCKQIMMEIDE